MINFLHNFSPDPILLSFGIFQIRWYSLFIIFGLIFGIHVALRLAKHYKISKDAFLDLFFMMTIFGIIGARIYHVLLHFDFYSSNLTEIIKIWHGGIAIHGAVIGGLLAVWIFIEKYNLFTEEFKGNKIEKFWIILAVSAIGLSLAQAIGRWGNYFNQELFGTPMNLPWGIPIDILNRPLEYINASFFHPTFLYESIGNLLIFLILLYLNKLVLSSKIKPKIIVFSYAILYSILRFFLEFLRIDPTPHLFNLRFPQVVSVSIILLAVFLIFKDKKCFGNKKII